MDSHTLSDNCLNALREHFKVSEPDPYVHLTVTKTDGNVVLFAHVRGIKFNDGMLTFEDEDERLYYVPNVSHWFNEYSEQQ